MRQVPRDIFHTRKKMSSLTIISPYNRIQQPYNHVEEIKFEEEPTFEAEWDPEVISQEEAHRYVAEIEARIVAQKGPHSPVEERIHWQMLERALHEECRLKENAQTKRTLKIEWDSDSSDESDLKRSI
jgi:hypothetical protein